MSKPTREELAQIRANLRKQRKTPTVAKSDGPRRTWFTKVAPGATAQTFGKAAHFEHATEFHVHQRTMTFAVKSRISAGAYKEDIMPERSTLPPVDWSLPPVPAVYRNGRWESA